MNLTPLEIRKQTFARKRLGGVDAEEVQDFLNLVAAEMENLLRENVELRDRQAEYDQKLDEYRTMEDSLRKTLVQAERISTESKDNAQRESDIILQQAHLRAERVLADARGRLRQLGDEIEELNKKKEVFLHRFRSLVQMQLELLEQHRGDYDEISRVSDQAQRMLDRYDRPSQAAVGDDIPPAITEEPSIADLDVEPVRADRGYLGLPDDES